MEAERGLIDQWTISASHAAISPATPPLNGYVEVKAGWLQRASGAFICHAGRRAADLSIARKPRSQRPDWTRRAGDWTVAVVVKAQPS